MKRTACWLMMGVGLLALVLSGCSSPPATSEPPTATPAPERSIPQVDADTITIDGGLDDWEARAWVAVDHSAYGSQVPASPDLEVRASFAFDAERFFLAVRAVDDDIQVVDRSWRYGDGFLFTLVTAEGQDRSSYVRQFGFDQQSKFLVFGNGEYFPPFDTQDVEFSFRQHDGGVDYEAAIPLSLLRPFNPFIYNEVALNLIYADRDGSAVTTVMICPDTDFDTERTRLRAGGFFALQTAAPQAAREAGYHVSLGRNYFRDGEMIELRYAVNAAPGQDQAVIRAALLGEAAAVSQTEIGADLQPGLNRGTLALGVGGLASGSYALQVAFQGQNGDPVSVYADQVFILNQAELDEVRHSLSTFRDPPALQPSLSNLEIRFEWFDEFYQRSNYEDISALSNWWGDVVHLRARLERGEPAVFDAGAIHRYAHRSNIDNTLQPYSVYLPQDFNADVQVPLVVALHGSGVDEQQFIQGFPQVADMLGIPVIAPKARGLSDYYTGNSGEDVFECIEHFVGLFPNIRRDRIFLTGFSMGGYGTWRLGSLKPDYFRGLIVLSGAVRPDLLSGMDRLGGANIFVLHGAQDNAVPVDGVRSVVQQLKALQANVTYIEIPEGGHGDFVGYDPSADLIPWIQEYSR